MTSVTKRFGLGLVAAALTQVGASAAVQAGAPVAPPNPAPRRDVVRAAEGLRDQTVALGRVFDGKAGIAVISLRDRWEIDWNANALFPQQSCSKLWVAITALDAVDHGKLSLDDRVTLGRSDLTLFHQPLRDKVLGGGLTTTLGSLMFDAITESDNTANDKLMRSVSGPQAVRDMIASKWVGSIRVSNWGSAPPPLVAGLIRRQRYSVGNTFYAPRTTRPIATRQT